MIHTGVVAKKRDENGFSYGVQRKAGKCSWEKNGFRNWGATPYRKGKEATADAQLKAHVESGYYARKGCEMEG